MTPNLPSDVALAVLQSLQAEVAFIDADGMILFANQAWTRFAAENGGSSAGYVGTNYLAVCRAAQPDITAAAALDGIQQVLSGSLPSFAMDYPCDSPSATRWFRLQVTRLTVGEQVYAVLAHYDLVRPGAAPQAETSPAGSHAGSHASHHGRLGSTAETARSLELASLDRLSAGSNTGVTARSFGVLPLREAAPTLFDDLVVRYSGALDMAVEQRMYKVHHTISTDLRVLAERLGFSRSGPRDVIDIHTAALRTKLQHGSKVVEAYFEESRILLLELMGHLASYYRNYAINPPAGRSPESTAVQPASTPAGAPRQSTSDAPGQAHTPNQNAAGEMG